MNVARGLKLHDLILSFLLLSRTNIGSKFMFVHYGKYGYSVTLLNLNLQVQMVLATGSSSIVLSP